MLTFLFCSMGQVSMQSKNRWGFIINPVAGNGYAATLIPSIEQHANRNKIDYEIVQTEYHEHERKLAHDLAVKGYNIIIAVGGDGTINQVVTGLLDNGHDVMVGVIPAGSGNDIAPMLGFTARFNEHDWDILFARNCIHMDVGICNGHYFVNGLGLGIDAEIAVSKFENAARKKEKLTSYLKHIIKTIVTFKEKTVTVISGEEETSGMCLIHTVGNGRRFGGGYYLTPEAIANDGRFDICAVSQLSLLERLVLFTRVPKGSHIKSAKVNYYKTDRILLQFNEKQPYHLDGEIYYDNQFTINILPRKLLMIYNPNGNHYFNEEQ